VHLCFQSAQTHIARLPLIIGKADCFVSTGIIPLASEKPPNTHSVQHFWLCGICCDIYALEYRDGRGVLIKDRPEISDNQETLRLIAAA
jgi:hypothetical protein